MTLKHIHELSLSLIIVLGISIASCTTVTVASQLTAASTDTVIPTQTSVPSTKSALTAEPSATLTLIPAFSFSKQVISSTNVNQIKQLDIRALTRKPEEFFSWSLDFTPDGHIVAATNKSTIYVWNALTGQSIITFDQFVNLWNIVISPNSKMVASFDDNGVLKLWDVQTEKEMYTLAYKDAWIVVWSLAFSPDSEILVSGDYDGNIIFWDIQTGQELNNLVDPNGSVSSIAFSPDGKVLATGTDSKITLWDVVSEQVTRTLDFDLKVTEGFGVQSVFFSPDGKMIAAADANNVTMIWNISSGEKLGTFVGKSTFLGTSEGAFAFSPDSKMIVTGDGDNHVTFWDIIANQELQTIYPEKCRPLDLIFWNKGNILEIGCDDGTLQFWGLP